MLSSCQTNSQAAGKRLLYIKYPLCNLKENNHIFALHMICQKSTANILMRTDLKEGSSMTMLHSQYDDFLNCLLQYNDFF